MTGLQILIKYEVRYELTSLYKACFASMKIDSQMKSKETFTYAIFGGVT